MEWIPVSERLPEEHVLILAYAEVKFYGPYFVMRLVNNKWEVMNDTYPNSQASELANVKPTHWMPLPERPKD